MNNTIATSIRPFIGAFHYEESRSFYKELGFEQLHTSDKFCHFKVNETVGFYLQDYYVKDWVDNTMVFLEVQDVENYWNNLYNLNLPTKYNTVRLSAIKQEEWGRECFLHDPSGVLWIIAQFSNK